jgi:hypothetical protein
MWSHRLFRSMIARQAINLDAALRSESDQILFRALDNCSRCGQKNTCREWLASAAKPASYVQFCPNSEAIEVLRIIGS